MKKVNYWKEQEKFSKHILKYVLNLLVSEKFIFKTTVWEYLLTYIDEKWTTDWWSQLTDKILKLNIKNLITKETLETFLYIESKAYFKEWSESLKSVEKSFKKFYTDLWKNIWYSSMYCIFKWWEWSRVYDFLDKLIEDTTNCPDSYFEITKKIFENKKFENTLIKLLEKTYSLEENKKYIEFKKYIKNNTFIINKLKEHLKKNIELSFNKYENSPKRLNIILEWLEKNKNISIKDKQDIKKGFKFNIKENKIDLQQANEEQKIYLLNKYQYFKNPLIASNIKNIEKELIDNIFIELGNSEYNKLKDCTDSFLEEFKEISFLGRKYEVKKYLFNWWKRQKRWFLFDSWSNEKCLFHYKNDNKILFINKN